jgi:orotate phosphoribosyltransferase/AMMECR1 domain-containing protein
MLDSLSVTLSPLGAELAGKLLLERLQRFDGVQLAAFGLTGVPILQSAVMQSGGRYHGLLVRSERKPHGSRKLIEGRVEIDEPVIMIEDSIASGTSVSEGIATLEASGLRVEGCVALVRFGWEGGCSSLCERGYHVEAVYDVFEDFMTRMQGEEGVDYNPTKAFEVFCWSSRSATEGLHPALLAREVLREYFMSGELLRPPVRLDRSDYDSSGGAWVSLRSREDIFDRHARDGFWHFPQEASWGVPEDIIRAAFRTACCLGQGAEPLTLLESSHLAVTLFSALERIWVGGLDNNRYGIVVVSGERPEIMGGALPRMPGIRDEWQQLRHARYNNAELYPFEPYTIYRHDVAKFVEPGATWPSSGVPQRDETSDLAVLATRARQIAMGEEPESAFPCVSLPESAAHIFVTLYEDGQVRGCMGSKAGDLREDLGELTRAAMTDERFDPVGGTGNREIAVSVSVLYNELEMGDFSREEVRFRYRHGQQALALQQNSRYGILLPLVAARMNLDAEDFVDEVIDKAGVTRPPYNWIRFDCVTWLADAEGTWKLDGGFRECPPTLTVVETAHLQLEYLLRNQRSDGSFYFGYYPFDNTLYQGIDIARQAHAAWILARSGQMTAMRAALGWALAQPENPALALSRDSFAVLALCECGSGGGMESSAAAERLLAAIDRHGRLCTWVAPAPVSEDESDNKSDNEEDPEAGFDPDELQSYVPGQVLLALAAAVRTGLIAADPVKIDQAFRYYRHRFRYHRNFGQVSWLALAFAAWLQVERNREWAEFVLEIADWILEFQHEGTGAFLTDHQPDPPGFTTAVYLEAVGAALDVTKWFSPEHQDRYESAWHRGFKFLDRLVVQDRDDSVLPNSGYAVGGVREALYSGHVRIDFVQHSLAAILEYDPEILVRNPLRQENQYGEKETGPDRGGCSAEKEEAHDTCGGSRATGQEA